MSLFSSIGGFLSRTLGTVGSALGLKENVVSIGSDALSTAGNILGAPNYKKIAAYQNELNKELIQEQLSTNKSLADHQFTLNQEAIRQQNEYNSPVQQMQRLKDAGLNPHLVYGSSPSGAAGNQSSVAQYPSISAPLRQATHPKMLELENYLVGQDVEMRQEQIRALSLKNDYQENKNVIQTETMQAVIESYNIINDLNKSKKEFNIAAKELKELEGWLIPEKQATEYAKRAKIWEDTQTARAMRDVIIPARKKLMEAEAAKHDETKAYLEKLAAGKDLQNDYERRTLEDRIKILAEKFKQAGYESTILLMKSKNWKTWRSETNAVNDVLTHAAKTLTSDGSKMLFDLLEAYLTGGTSLVKEILYNGNNKPKKITITETNAK